MSYQRMLHVLMKLHFFGIENQILNPYHYLDDNAPINDVCVAQYFSFGTRKVV